MPALRRILPLLLLVLPAGPAGASPFSPSTLDAQIQQCIQDVNPDSLFSYIQQMQDFTTRHTSSDTSSTTTGIGAARRWVHDKFVEFANQGGNITASYFDFEGPISGVDRLHRNVIGEIPGTVTGPEHRIYVIGGHLDSRNEDVDDFVGSAFGADDDASGVACALELARVMSMKSWPMTLRFIGFVGEEQGLIGADHYSFDLLQRGEPLAGMLNNDTMASIIGAPHPDSTVMSDTTLARAFSTGPEQSVHRNLARYLKAMGDVYVPIQDIVLIPAEDRPSRGGDHQAFAADGFPAVRYMEYLEEVWRQHTTLGDTLGPHLSATYLQRNAQVDLALLGNLAFAPASPTGLTVADVGDSTGFRLIWPSVNPEPDLETYLVTVRAPGALDYDQVIEVGMVNEYTFASAANESLFFGLSVRDSSDHRAPVGEEVLGVLSSVPVAPGGVVVTSGPASLQLDWNPSAEADLDGYHVYRSETEGSGYLPLTGSPLPSPQYVDNTALPYVRYYYVVTAVDTGANESPFSNEDDGRLVTLDSGLLLVDETRNGTNAWFPTDAGADSVYANMLAGLPHDVWDYDTDGPPDLSDLGMYSTVLWVGDDYNRTFQGFPILTAFLRDVEETLDEYLTAGGNVMAVGWEPARGFGYPEASPFEYGPGDFLWDWFGIASLDRANGARFAGGLGEGIFADVALEPTRLRSSWGGKLTRGEFGTLRPGANLGFRFDSTDPDSAYHQAPCAAYFDHGANRTVFWGFPLYHLTTADGAAALQAAMTWLEAGTSDAPVLTGAGDTFGLGRGRPNPFAHETHLDYVVPGEAAQVDLSVYDVAGRRIASLVRGRVLGGRHTAIWDGRNSEGLAVASGVYFVRLHGEAANGEKVERHRKIVFLRR